MTNKRSIISLSLIIPLLLFIGVIKPKAYDPILQNKIVSNQYWINKTHSKNKYDMILMGNSLVYRGLSPEVMNEELPGYKIFNFGYSNGSLNSEMFNEAKSHLERESNKKVLVLGIYEAIFFDKTKLNLHFHEKKLVPKEDIFIYKTFPNLVNFISPIDLDDYIRKIRNKRLSFYYFEEFHDDGWIASWTDPYDSLRLINKLPTPNSDIEVSEHLVDMLLKETIIASSEGITVYGFRPPISKLADSLYLYVKGFDRNEFIKKFEAAGGVWLSPKYSNLSTYDGLHLEKTSAIKFSKAISKAIAKELWLP